MPRMLLQQTLLRGSRNWVAVAARRPNPLAPQTLDGAADAGDAPLDRATQWHGTGNEARRGFMLSSLLGVNVEVGSMGESITGTNMQGSALGPRKDSRGDERCCSMEPVADTQLCGLQRAP